MDAEITLERYCKKNKIDIDKYSDAEWEHMVKDFENKLESYFEACYKAGQFNDFLDLLLNS